MRTICTWRLQGGPRSDLYDNVIDMCIWVFLIPICGLLAYSYPPIIKRHVQYGWKIDFYRNIFSVKIYQLIFERLDTAHHTTSLTKWNSGYFKIRVLETNVNMIGTKTELMLYRIWRVCFVFTRVSNIFHYQCIILPFPLKIKFIRRFMLPPTEKLLHKIPA